MSYRSTIMARDMSKRENVKSEHRPIAIVKTWGCRSTTRWPLLLNILLNWMKEWSTIVHHHHLQDLQKKLDYNSKTKLWEIWQSVIQLNVSIFFFFCKWWKWSLSGLLSFIDTRRRILWRLVMMYSNAKYIVSDVTHLQWFSQAMNALVQ